MKKVYCKKDYIVEFIGIEYELKFIFRKYNEYYINESNYFGNGVSVFVSNFERTNGRWVNFDEYFTFDEKILRQAKLERIIDDESIL